MTTIPTVLGPLDTAALGFTLMHEHLVAQSPGIRDNWPDLFDRDKAVRFGVERLGQAKAAGVDTVVEMTTMDNGRDVRLYQEIVQQVGINLVVCTGLWRKIPRVIEMADPTRIADMFVRDIEVGIQGTDIRAGILKNASDDRLIEGPQEVAHRAVARAHRRTGIPISTHTNVHTQSGLDQQRVYLEEGVDLSRVIIGHSGDAEDLGYLKRLLDRGCYLGMDRFGLDHFGAQRFLDTAQRVRLVAELCRQGFADRLVLSHDTSAYPDGRSIEYQDETWPEWRYTLIPSTVVPMLLEAGVSQRQVDQMTRDNPRRVFERQGAY